MAKFMFLTAMLVASSLPVVVQAGQARGGGDERVVETVVDKMSAKFWRGLVNVVTGVGELPRQVSLACTDRGTGVGLPVGLLTGVLMTPVRIGVGAFEMITFIVPTTPQERSAGRMTYAPTMLPVFVWQDPADDAGWRR